MSELDRIIQMNFGDTEHNDEAKAELEALIAERERAARIEALQYAHDLDPSLPDEEHCTCLPWLQWKLEEEIERLATLTKEKK